MPADPTHIGTTATALLGLVVDTLEFAGRPVGRSYVSHGAPAWDLCRADQVSVYLSPIAFRSSGSGRQQQTQLQATFHVQIVRCVPVPDQDADPPSAVELHDSGVGLVDDMARVIYAVLDGAGDVFGGCESVTFGQASPLGPLGGAGGWDWPITVTT